MKLNYYGDARTWRADDQPTPDGTHHTTAHRCADDDVQPHTCHTPEFAACPSGDSNGANRAAAPDAASELDVVLAEHPVVRHGRVRAATNDATLDDAGGVADNNLGSVGDHVLHTVIQPQTGAGVNHKSATVLFAGAGGSSLGLEQAGYHTTGYEYWKPAADTHNANGMVCRLQDLSDPFMDWNIPPTARLLWASPPCQPFSAAGDGGGEFDDRDGFPWTLRIIGKKRPEVVIIENVKGLTFAKHHAYFVGILASLRELGYDVDWRVLNSADYGVPQTRERCFIIARRDNKPIAWPAPTHTQGDSLFLKPWVTMAQALGWGMTERPFHAVATSSPTGGPRMDGAGGSGARAALYAERDSGRWILNYRQWRPTADGGRELIVTDVTDKPSPSIGTKSSEQWVLTNERPLHVCGDHVEHVCDCPTCCDVQPWPYHRPATTIAGDTRVFQPGGHHQPGEQSQNAIRLTIAELARLQDFPDDYVWCGTKTDQARQIGNAVCPTMARVLAEVNRP